MNELTKWFDAVTFELSQASPAAFAGVDLVQARTEISRLATLVTQVDGPPFSIRNTRGGSGQSDGN